MGVQHIFGPEAESYSDVTEVVPGVFVDPGESVTIVDEEGEIAHWTADEWAEDSDVVTATVNACILAAAKGSAAVRRNIDLPKGSALTALIDETAAKVRPEGDAPRLPEADD